MDTPQPAGTTEQVYDGFISYSHAADGLLAPRLQAGLQRFAKPWWKRRALRIFRDESSLSANPHLWSSITEALDTSGWFVLLLSPDAAQSEWVNQEVAYWVEHRDPDRIIPVLTDGEFGWDGDVAGDAVPDALRGALSEEPRWVDLRFAKDEDQLDLQDPRFADAVADVASAMRGVPKDELASEEVRQHRRTVRTAWAAGALLFVLAIAAGWGGVMSARNAAEAAANADEAARQASIAEEAAETARAEAARADANAEEANAERNNALEAAALARSQAFAASSSVVLDVDPELATLLAVLSARTAPGEVPAESLAAVREADATNLLRYRIPVVPGPGEEVLLVQPAPGGFVTASAIALTRYEAATGDEVWSTRPEGLDRLISFAASPAGDLAVLTGPSPEGVGQVLVHSLEDGSLVHRLEEECPYPGWYLGARPFTPDGALLAYGTGESNCLTESWVSLVDTTSWEEVDRLSGEGMAGQGPSFSGDGSVMMITDEVRAEVRSFPEFDLLAEFGQDTCCYRLALSPAGDRVAFGGDEGPVGVYDVRTGDRVATAEGTGLISLGTGSVFGPDGSRLLVLSRDGAVLVESETGRLLHRLGGLEPVFDAAFLPDEGLVVTVGPRGLATWQLGAGRPLDPPGTVVSWIDPDAIVEGPRAATLAVVGDLRPGAETALLVLDEATGAVRHVVPAAAAVQLPDGRFVVAGTESEGVVPDDPSIVPRMVGQTDRRITGLRTWDPTDGSSIPLVGCDLLMSATERFALVPATACGDGSPVFAAHQRGPTGLAVSPDGTKVAASSGRIASRPAPDVAFCGHPDLGVRETWVWAVETGEVVARVKHDECRSLIAMGDDYLVLTNLTEADGLVVDFSGAEVAQIETTPNATLELTADGRHLITHGVRFGTIVVYDTADWSEVARWDADDGLILGVAISLDQTKLVTTGEVRARVWDIADLVGGGLGPGARPPLLDEIPLVGSDARWIDADTLGLLLREGQWVVVDLDPGAVVDRVASRLNRSFTPEECADYRIDPCPTLADLREG